MTKSNESDVGTLRFALMSVLYQTDIHFSLLSGFLDRLNLDLDATHPTDNLPSLLESRLTAAESRLRSSQSALDRAVADDVTRIIETLHVTEPTSLILSESQIIARLNKTASQAQRILSESGIDAPIPGPTIVDSMPEPYDARNSAALVVDSYDEDEYGIPQGIYLRRSNLRPYYSDFLYLHELVHVYLGSLDPKRVAHGLEEGLADYLGAIWLAGSILGLGLTRRLFILNRLSSATLPFWNATSTLAAIG